MKTWAFGAFGTAAISALALVACSSSSGGNSTTAGTGATGTTVASASHAASTGTGATTTTTTGSGGTGGSDPCTSPEAISDCGSCATQSDCSACASMLDQPGVMAYNTIINCVFCDACYTTCDGAATLGQAGGCTAAPTTADACDVGAASMTTCDTCQMCSTKTGATCAADLAACEGNTQCNDLLMNLSTTCSGLPM